MTASDSGQSIGGDAFVVNAPSARSKGVEVEGQFRPVENLNLNATVSYYHAAAMLNRGSDGAQIRPDQLSRSDQRMLKGAFQTIRSLVEQISSGYFWRVR